MTRKGRAAENSGDNSVSSALTPGEPDTQRAAGPSRGPSLIRPRVPACPKKKCFLPAGHDDGEHGTNEQVRFNRAMNRRWMRRTRPAFESRRRSQKIARPPVGSRDLVQVRPADIHPRHLRNP